MLKSEDVEFEFRDYMSDPLSVAEIRDVLAALDVPASEMLRSRDPAAKELGLSVDSPADELVAAMAEHPGLLHRPIGVRGSKAIYGRPIENLLEI